MTKILKNADNIALFMLNKGFITSREGFNN